MEYFWTVVMEKFLHLIYFQHIFIVDFPIKVLKNIWFGLGKVLEKSLVLILEELWESWYRKLILRHLLTELYFF